jgi:hypothetical protein
VVNVVNVVNVENVVNVGNVGNEIIMRWRRIPICELCEKLCEPLVVRNESLHLSLVTKTDHW